MHVLVFRGVNKTEIDDVYTQWGNHHILIRDMFDDFLFLVVKYFECEWSYNARLIITVNLNVLVSSKKLF